MKKTILMAILGSAIPLAIALFAFYEIYREKSTIVLRSELTTFKGAMDSVLYEKNSTVLYFHQQNKVISFSSRPATNELYDTIQKGEFFDEDTFTVQYANKNQKAELITFTKNDKELISYGQYYNYMQTEIDEGPKAAAIAFSIISGVLFIIIILSPLIEKSTRNSVHNKLLKIKGIKVINDNKYELRMGDYKVNLSYELNIGYRRENPSYIRIVIYLPDSFSSAQIQNVAQELYLENADSSYFYEIKHKNFFKPLHTSVVRRIEKEIEEIESLAYSANREKESIL